MTSVHHADIEQGAGNTVFPLLNHNENPELELWATDYSAQAVEVVKVSLVRYLVEQGTGAGAGNWAG